MGANLIDRFVGLGLQLALLPILVSAWGLARYGGWAMLSAVPGVLALGDLGFAMAASVRMTMELARGERGAAQATLHSATQVVLVAAGLILMLALAAAWWLPDRLLSGLPGTPPGELRWAIALLAAYTGLVLIAGLVIGLFRATARFAAGSLLNTLTQLLEGGLLIAAVLLGHGLAGAALALVAGRLVGLAAGLVLAARAGQGLLPGLSHGSAEVRRELLGPALAAMAIPLAFALLLQGQVMVLGLVAGAATVPAFVAARTLSRIGLQAAQTLTFPIMPEFGTAAAQGDSRRLTRLFAVVAGTALVIALVFAAGLALAGPWLVWQWSHQQVTAAPALMLAISASALFGCLWNPLSNLILAINRQASFAVPFVFAAAAALAATFALAPQLGALGPALALAAVDAVMLGVVVRFAWREWGGPRAWLAAASALTSEGLAAVRRSRGRGR